MKAHQAEYPIKVMCEVLELSRSGYYDWLSRPPSLRSREDAALSARIRAIHEGSRATYGVPRVHAELRAEGVCVGRKRVARLMKQDNLEGVSRRRRFKTTVRGRERHGIPDLVKRDFSVTGKNQLWVADITYLPTTSGFLFLAVVLDAWSRRVVGWSFSKSLHTEIVLRALNMALEQRRPDDVIHHSGATPFRWTVDPILVVEGRSRRVGPPRFRGGSRGGSGGRRTSCAHPMNS